MTKMEHDETIYKTLLESTLAIPWKIDWANQHFSYIGPQIERLLGWTPESWQTVGDWVERMHPDDQKWVPEFCVSQSKAGIDHEADYRALAKNGDYVWIRDVVHVVRDASGNVEALVGFMFDISERKRNEERIRTLQRELEDMSFKDGLTGLVNRRRFDGLFEQEWRAARRTKQPLSVILADIDFFKQFNDHYGHIRGDDCLKRVARALAGAASRPRDVVARYGGEEFVIVVPETDVQGALAVALRCRDAVAHEAIAHEQSAIGDHVTISAGVGSIVPGDGDDPVAFLAAVDRSLYRAKELGRDKVVAIAE